MCELIEFHPNASAAGLRAGMVEGLRQRRLDPKYHYLTPAQAQAWLALHRAYSPFVTDPQTVAIYDTAFARVAQDWEPTGAQVLSLAAGGAAKELRLVRALQAAGKSVTATVSDISEELVRASRERLAGEGGLGEVRSVVVDLLGRPPADAEWLGQGGKKIICCFGLMPNVEPLDIARRLAGLTGPEDVLLVGTNLAPEDNYEAGTHAVLAGYDNAGTRGWLGLLLDEIGLAAGERDIRFTVAPCASRPDILQIVGTLHLRSAQTVTVSGETIQYAAGETVRLFYSNRYTPGRLERLFRDHGLAKTGVWVSPDATEGIIALRQQSAG